MKHRGRHHPTWRGVTIVAPHAGAWIETLRPRGERQRCICVAPHAGAWIETVEGEVIGWSHGSPPTRGRGLKPPISRIGITTERSPPTRGRGLKREVARSPQWSTLVAPHAGAWIETLNSISQAAPVVGSPPTRGRGLKHRPHRSPSASPSGRPPRGGVD